MAVSADRWRRRSPLADPVRRRLAAAAFLPGWLALIGTTAASLAGLSLPVEWRYGLLLATALALGLPHGALDYHSLVRVRSGAPARRWAGRFALGYLASALAFAAVWFVAPAVAFLGFLVLTWYHWGRGDRYALRRFAGASHLGNRWVARGVTVVRGGVPILVPLAAFPSRYEAVVEAVLGAFGAAGALDPLLSREAGLFFAAVLAVVTAATLVGGRLTGGSATGWWIDAAETALLWFAFALVSPLVALAVYFACWHSVRHLVRAVALDDVSLAALRAPGDGGRRQVAGIGFVVRRTARQVVPATAGALVLAAAIWLAAPAADASIPSVAGVYLAVLAALTVPHALVVDRLDAVERV